MEIFCAAGANSHANSIGDTDTFGDAYCDTYSDTDSFGNAYCNSDNNTDGYANARYTDSYAKSDPATSPDTLSAPHSVVVRWKSLCGNPRNKFASSRSGTGRDRRASKEP